MFRLAAFRSRRLLAAAVLACLAVTAVPASAEPLVSPEWLKGHLSDPSVVVLDVRSSVDGGGAEAYARAHIPGAVHSDYDKAGWRVTRNGMPLMLPSSTQLEKLIGETGIDEDSHVVIVPAGVSATDFGSAARIYWTLKVAGHPTVSILDGGFAAWQAVAYPVESGKRTPSPRIFTVKFDQSLLAEMQQVERNEHATLVDARPASFFEGKMKAPASKAYGHIPGALNVDSASFYDPATNRLRPREQLARVAAAIPSGPVVAYCNTGHWAATDWFVLSAVLGRPDVRLYDGSMVEWTADAHRAVASSRTRLDDLKKALGFGS
jgi:thiosulfate/3-mercaptopyruvate sulfurtransferase